MDFLDSLPESGECSVRFKRFVKRGGGILVAFLFLVASLGARSMTPGVYREYTVNTRIGDSWRVTDPAVDREDARVFLPNAVFTLEDVDLSNAIRAELTMHHWAGHSGTEGQQIIINGTHRLDVPVNPGLALDRAHLFLNCDNPLLEVPLTWLKDGTNTFEGTIAEAFRGTHWWGQWGWYWFKVRIHLAEPDLPLPDGRLIVDAPGKEISGDSVQLSFTRDGSGSIDEVEYYAKYVGFDDDGDGEIHDWHGFDDLSSASSENVGRSSTPPYAVSWDVSWIPDQPSTISFIAVIRQGAHSIRVTEPVDGYTLKRDYSVKLIQPESWPKQLIRNGGSGDARLFVPSEYPLAEVSAARIAMRSWNGQNNEEGSTPISINSGEKIYGIISGSNHYFGYDNQALPTAPLSVNNSFRAKPGQVDLRFSSSTVHHGCEILVPGPCLLLRWNQNYPDYLRGDRPQAPGW